MRTGNEMPAPLSPPSHARHAAPAFESISPLSHSERTATVENLRNIAEGHACERVDSHDWLSSPSCGKGTATVLFGAPEVSISPTDGKSVPQEGFRVTCNESQRAERDRRYSTGFAQQSVSFETVE